MQKLSLYQKGWQRMSKMVNSQDDGGKINALMRTGLLEQSKNYFSPRADALCNLYDSTMIEMENCRYDFKRS